MTVLERLNEYVHFTRKSTPQLAKDLGVSEGGLRDALKGKNQPSAKILMPLFVHGLSIDWLFSGEGEMLREKLNRPNSKNAPLNDMSIFTKLLEEKDDMYKKMIESYQATNTTYKELLQEKDERIKDKDERLKDKEKMINLLISSSGEILNKEQQQ